MYLQFLAEQYGFAVVHLPGGLWRHVLPTLVEEELPILFCGGVLDPELIGVDGDELIFYDLLFSSIPELVVVGWLRHLVRV